VHRARGTGKTLIGRWAAQQQDAKLAAVFLPSLHLVAQTLAEWRRPGGWPLTALVVCSDPTTVAGIAERRHGDPGAAAATWRTNRVPVTTDPGEVAAFLASPGRKVLFGTYHSAPVIAAALRPAGARLDLAVLDEAHNLAGYPSPAFRAVLDDGRIPASRRLVLTATQVLAGPAAHGLPDGGHSRPALSMSTTDVTGR
jgi:predicted helicase